MGIVPLYPDWARKVIIELFEHQRTNGWMPRQVSTISREAPHDMRYFSDGGAFLLELIHIYLTYTRDYALLDEKVWWLDSDQESTVLEHVFKTTQYYLDPINIGEHGLCKVWHGDWWDVMDKIGLEGRGETVTVTGQMVLNLKNLADMLDWLATKDTKYEQYLPLKDTYLTAREKFINAMQTHAYNKLGFFNGYFNDNGKWLLSDNDPDGRERLYLVSNSWAIIGGCCTEEMQKSTGCCGPDLEGIAFISRSVEGVLVGVTLKQTGADAYKVSLRTYPPFDASAICRTLGGGGHVAAAGANVYGTLEEAKKQVLDAIVKYAEENNAGFDTAE
jgi:cellobiose phosphorylase